MGKPHAKKPPGIACTDADTYSQGTHRLCVGEAPSVAPDIPLLIRRASSTPRYHFRVWISSPLVGPEYRVPHGPAFLAADGDHASTVAPPYAAHHKWYRVGSIAPEGDALRAHLSAASVNRLAAAGGAPAGAVGLAISRRCAVA